MSLRDQICHALCDDFIVSPVPIGFAVKSPFKWYSGDNLVFYVRMQNGQLRLEDDGATYGELQAMGVDFSSDTRLDVLAALLKEHEVEFDQSEFLFHTRWVSDNSVGVETARFLSFMNRLQDLLFWTYDRVASTFADDLYNALKAHFVGKAEVVRNEAPVVDLSDYPADIVVRHQSGKVAAIFPVNREQKALEAILFSKEMELREASNIVPFMVYEDFETSNISKRTKSRALNSDLELATWDGGSKEVISKVERQLQVQAA